jgi:hypothetical protein
MANPPDLLSLLEISHKFLKAVLPPPAEVAARTMVRAELGPHNLLVHLEALKHHTSKTWT